MYTYMSRRSQRNLSRFDYLPYDRKGVKRPLMDKGDPKVKEVVKKDQALTMENTRAIDEAEKVDLEIERFWDEYDLAELDGIDDVKECISELKEIIRKYESAHVELRRTLGDQEHKETYGNYDKTVKQMTDWIKLARKEISLKRASEKQEMSSRAETDKDKEREAKVTLEKSNLETEVKYLEIKTTEFLSTIDIEAAEHVEEVENSLLVVKELLGQLVDLHHKLDVIHGTDYEVKFGAQFKEKKASLSNQLSAGVKRIKTLRDAEKTALLNKEEAEAKRVYDDKVSLAEFIFSEISTRSDNLTTFCKATLKSLGDDEILERKKNVMNVNLELNAILDNIIELVKETPSKYEAEKGVVQKAKEKREELQKVKNEYVVNLDSEINSRDLNSTKLKNSSSLEIDLPKFRGYNSTLDIYSFQAEFEKLIAPNVQKKIQPEYLKKNYLEGQALLLVKEIQEMDQIWVKLKVSFGCTMLLLQNKLGEVKKCGELWKIKDKEKLMTGLSKLVNSMVELKALAEKHSIKDQLYHHSYIGMIYDVIGDQRKEKFAYKNAGVQMSGEEKWAKLMKFLTVEMTVLEELLMDEKSRQSKPEDETSRNKDPKNGNRDSKGKERLAHPAGTGPREKAKCAICGKDDHVTMTSKAGQDLVHYIACEKWVNMTLSERFQELKNKDLCFQCLYPGKKNNHEGTCFNQYACKHGSHRRFNKSKHVLVCEEHKDEAENKELFEKYKKRFVTNSKIAYKDFTKNITFYADAYVEDVVDSETETVKDRTIFMLQTILVEGVKLNLFFDSGCGDLVSRKEAADKLEVLGRASNIKPGPLLITGVGDKKSVCKHGVYSVTLPLHNGRNVEMNGLCMEVVTSEFPTYQLKDVERDIHKEYRKKGKDPSQLPKLPVSVGGATDLLIGCQYLKYHPKEIFELPCGLKVYESQFVSADGSRGVIAGPHHIFTSLARQLVGSNVSLQSYCSDLLRVYMEGYKVSLDVPLLGTGKPVSDVVRCDEEQVCSIFEVTDPLVPVPDTKDSLVGDSNSSLLDDFLEIENAGTYPIDDIQHCQCCTECTAYPGKRSAIHLEKMFRDCENAGTDVSHRCVKCRNCPDCKISEQIEEISIREEVEQSIINRSVKVDLDKGETTADLPFIKDPVNRLSSNEAIALKVYKYQTKELAKTPKEKEDTVKSEDKLQQLGFVDWFDNLTEEEKIMILESPINHFIPWRVVWNPNSLSTFCRLVFDASMRTNKQYSLNDLVAKGRNNMNKLVEIMIRWMIYKFAFHADIQKMYNSIKLNRQFWSYQLYLWDEGLDPTKHPKWKVIKTLIYGVKSSGNQAERGLRQTAELQKEQYPRASEVIQKSTYVDDCPAGEPTAELRDETIDDMEVVVRKGGYKFKGFTKSGSDPPEHLTEDGESVLVAGLRWFPKEDTISLNIGELNFAKKKRGKKSSGVLGVIPDSFTRKDCAGKVAEVYDLLGKVTPITAGWKLDLTVLTKRKLDWDDQIPDDLKAVWIQNFQEMNKVKEIKFNRAVVPIDAVNLDIETIDFGDASRVLICAAIYARFKLKNGGYSCQLVFSKSKVVPDNTTMPRAELSAAVLNARIGFVVQRSFGKYFKGCLKLTDGQIVLHWIHNQKIRLKLFPRNRVIEIHRLSEIENWLYIDTKNMIADLGTRKGATIEDVSPDSVWINLYPWAKLERSQFPVKTVQEIRLDAEQRKQFNDECLDSAVGPMYGYAGVCLYALCDTVSIEDNVPADEGVGLSAYTGSIVPVEEVKKRYQHSNYIIDPNKFRFRKSLRVQALVMMFVRKLKKRKGKDTPPVSSTLKKIEIPVAFMFKYDQHLVTQSASKTESTMKCKDGLVVSLTEDDIRYALEYFYRKATEEVKMFVNKKVYQKISTEIDGILYYSGRILPSQTFTGMLNLSDVTLDLTAATFCVPLTEYRSPFAYSIVSETHWYNYDANHSGVETVLRYTQKIAFVLGGRELVKKYRKNCARCRALAKKAVEVAMGPVHPSNLNIAPAFFTSQVDIFGPVSSYSNVNKRATVKLWFVVFCCCSTTAIDVKTMEDYTTESFILAFTRFACKVGYPKKLMPDEGSQLVKGCNVMTLEFFDIKHKLHQEFGVDFETCPVGAHYQHGRVERKIKHVQESFLKVADKKRLSLLQWETLGDQVANSVNNQPIAVGNIVEDVENLDILTPNRLLLGRNNGRSPTGNLQATSDPRKIIQTNNEIFKSWFECWLISYIPTLIQQPKWFNSDRDVKAGDVILFLKSDKEFDKQYQYGLVKTAIVGRDGKVREVDIEYQNHNESVKRRTLRGTRDIVVIHPVDEIGIELELGAIAKSCGY